VASEPAGGSMGSGAGAPGGSEAGAEACLEAPYIPERRLVRLTLAEVAQSIRALLGADLGDQLVETFGVGGVTTRSFPPLAAPQEGTFVTEAVWSKAEGMGQATAQYVRDNYESVTGCQPSDAGDACALEYALTLAERAFRRPLEPADRDSLTLVYTESKSLGADVPDALKEMIWAIFTAPHFLYRTELGAPATAAAAEVALTPHEVASQLAFFLSAAPPDAALLDAAANGTLSTPEGILSQVDRLLADPIVQDNLGYALASYFGINNLGSVVIDSSRAPEFSVGLREAMYRETQDFLRSTVRGGTLDALVTSRRTVVNPALAELYEVPFPAGEGSTADTFVEVELPATRSGLLTQAGFLTARARPDTDSVVSRALMISSTLLCQNNPSAPPAALAEEIESVRQAFADKSERELSEYRTSTAPCSGCHATFDAFGLVLQNFDLIGRYRTVDTGGRPIDASATLPASAGGAEVRDAVEFARALADNGTFAACMTRNLMKYALAEGNLQMNDCAVRNVAERFLAGDGSFSSLIREIVTSKTFLVRASGGTP
jgi:PAS domain-containing protein